MDDVIVTSTVLFCNIVCLVQKSRVVPVNSTVRSWTEKSRSETAVLAKIRNTKTSANSHFSVQQLGNRKLPVGRNDRSQSADWTFDLPL
jgi:hypothetical protein